MEGHVSKMVTKNYPAPSTSEKKKVLLEFSRKHTFSPIIEVADKE